MRGWKPVVASAVPSVSPQVHRTQHMPHWGQRPITSRRDTFAKAATAGGSDLEHIARLHQRRADMAQLFHLAIGTQHAVGTGPAGGGGPPAMPKAGFRRPLDKMLAVIASRKRTRRTPPSPPAQRPAPPDPRWISELSSTTGKRNSSTSGSVRGEL